MDDTGADEASGAGEGPSSSSGGGGADHPAQAAEPPSSPPAAVAVAVAAQQQQQQLSRYESQKRRDWNTFLQYLKNHKPPLTLARCSGAHVIEFLKYLDQFGKTKVHASACAYFGHPSPPAPCACPLRQAWGSLDALIGRLRAAYEESGGKPESNPFGARAVRIYLREIRETQAKARGIPYEKKKRKRPSASATTATDTAAASSSAAAATPQPSSAAGEPSSSSAAAAVAEEEEEGSGAEPKPEPSSAA